MRSLDTARTRRDTRSPDLEPKMVFRNDLSAVVKTPNKQNLNVRKFPDSNAEIIGSFKDGTEVHVEQIDDPTWAKVKDASGDTVGYCVSKYLSNH